jgi:uncharacterized protein involved in outer membrane biogenesis
MRLKELAVPFEGVNAHLTLSESVIGMEHLNAGIGEGTLKANGSLSDYLGRQIYQLGLDLKDVKMAELIDQTEFPVKVQGTVLSALKIKGQGFDPAVMFDPLSGGGSFELTDGKLTDINILKVVLDKIAVVPNFRQAIEDSIPPKYKEKIRQKDTILTKVSATLMIQNGRVNIAPIDLNADSFLFEGTGSVGFDQTFDMQGSFIIPADLAAAMVAAVGELELLQDFDGTIRFPLKVEGKGAALKFAPDIKSIGNAVIKNKARQEIGNILNKVLKTDGETAAPPSQPQSPAPSSPTDTPPAKDKSAEQILIENILDKIFK